MSEENFVLQFLSGWMNFENRLMLEEFEVENCCTRIIPLSRSGESLSSGVKNNYNQRLSGYNK